MMIRIGAYDYYSGLDFDSMSVKANFAINGHTAGTELAPLFKQTGNHIWTLQLQTPLVNLSNGHLVVSIKDHQGNKTEINRHFQIQGMPPRT